MDSPPAKYMPLDVEVQAGEAEQLSWRQALLSVEVFVAVGAWTLPFVPFVSHHYPPAAFLMDLSLPLSIAGTVLPFTRSKPRFLSNIGRLAWALCVAGLVLWATLLAGIIWALGSVS